MRQVRREKNKETEESIRGPLTSPETDGKESARDHKCQDQPRGPGCPLYSHSRPPREGGQEQEREMEVAPQPSSSSFSFWFLGYLPSLYLYSPPTPPRPLAKSQGFEVSRSLATSPVRPREPDSSLQAVGWHLERCLPAGTPPLPTSSPHSALSRAVSLSIPPPSLVLPPVPLALPPFAFILLSPPLQPPLSSPSPLLSSPLPPAPPLGSPSRRAAPP